MLDSVKLLWDFHVQSDHVIEHCRPDLLLVKKKTMEAVIIDIAVPSDVRITEKEKEKILKYQDLKREIKTVWQLRLLQVVDRADGSPVRFARVFSHQKALAHIAPCAQQPAFWQTAAHPPVR
ncbi:hypothetical protein ACHWQZ_G012684 [Mnemiopsis leidyi]